MPGIEAGSAACKAITLPAVLSLWAYFILLKYFPNSRTTRWGAKLSNYTLVVWTDITLLWIYIIDFFLLQHNAHSPRKAAMACESFFPSPRSRTRKVCGAQPRAQWLTFLHFLPPTSSPKWAKVQQLPLEKRARIKALNVRGNATLAMGETPCQSGGLQSRAGTSTRSPDLCTQLLSPL